MKYSEAMLKGFEQVNGRQCKEAMHEINCHGMVVAHCALGAIEAGGREDGGFVAVFYDAWGVAPHHINDEGMPWEHIYGMSVAAGL